MDRTIVNTVDIPMRLPKLIYFYFSPPTAEDYSMKLTVNKALLAGLFLITNILIYAVPVYILLAASGKFGPKGAREWIYYLLNYWVISTLDPNLTPHITFVILLVRFLLGETGLGT